MNHIKALLRWTSLLLLMLLLLPSGVMAHAELMEASPAPGQEFFRLRPREVKLDFSQELTDVAIVVTDRDFRPVHEGEAWIDEADPYVAHVKLTRLDTGTYTVNWRATSIDTHTVEGSYEFAVDLETPVAAVFTRYVAVAVFLAMGVLIFLRRARPGDETE